MKFEKQCQFLEAVRHVIQRDNSVYYAVSLRIPGEGIFTVNIMESRSDVLSVLSSCDFGTVLTVVFSLRASDKAYRLGVDSVALYQ